MTSDDLIRGLSAAGLLAEHDAAVWQQKASSAANDAPALAGRLVRHGLLTKFQAAQALAGKAKALVLGEYVIFDRLGAGAMGQVYKAEHRRMKRLVALKLSENQWFTLEVIANGDLIEVKVNDRTTASYRDPDRTYRIGHVALQQVGEDTVLEFRDIEIRELTPQSE